MNVPLLTHKEPEFNKERSERYLRALTNFPEARKDSLQLMNSYLQPKKTETILEIWCGSGFFSKHLSDLCEKLIVCDPSPTQLKAVIGLCKNNITVIQGGWEDLGNLPKTSVDAIRSFSALHHSTQKDKSFQNFGKALKSWGRVVIVDILAGSSLAKYFDDKVAKYAITGHEVSYLTPEYFDTLAFKAWLVDVEVISIDLQRHFNKKADIWEFVWDLHAMSNSPEDCLQGAEEMLGIEESNGQYHLNRPLVVFRARKP